MARKSKNAGNGVHMHYVIGNLLRTAFGRDRSDMYTCEKNLENVYKSDGSWK